MRDISKSQLYFHQIWNDVWCMCRKNKAKTTKPFYVSKDVYCWEWTYKEWSLGLNILSERNFRLCKISYALGDHSEIISEMNVTSDVKLVDRPTYGYVYIKLKSIKLISVEGKLMDTLSNNFIFAWNHSFEGRDYTKLANLALNLYNIFFLSERWKFTLN